MNILMVAAVAAAAGSAAEPTQTEATNKVVEIPPVTVYASRIDDVKENMASHVQVFDAKAIAASGARDLSELLKKKAGIGVQNMNGTPQLTSLAMRGFGENSFGRIKVILDGEELNNVDMSSPNISRIPIWNVERVEVIHGPSPVLYGDGAVAGVVNVTTDTRDYEKKTRISGRAGSQNTFGGTVQTKGGFEEEGVTYAAGYDYLRSSGYRSNSGYGMHTANAAIRKNFENGSSVGFKANYQNSLYRLPGALTYDEWKHARKSTNNPDDWARLWSYGIGLDAKLKLADDQWLFLDAVFAHRLLHAVYPSPFAPSDTEQSSYQYAFSPRYVNEMDVFGFGNKFTVGMDFRFDRYSVDGIRWGAPIKQHFDRGRYAGFLHDEFFLTEELSIIAGARLEAINNRWSGVAGVNKPKTTDWKGDYELGLVYRPIEGLKTYVKGTRFHRSAFCDEMSFAYLGDPIKPETGTSLDLGVEWTFLKEFTFDVNGYGSWMEDEIFYDPTPGIWANRNIPGKTRRFGADVGLSWLRDKFAEASVRYGIVHAEFASGTYHGKDVPFVPNHRIRGDVGYWIIDDLEIKGGYTFVSSQYLAEDFGNEFSKLPSYSLFDVGLYYAPSWAKGWKASFVMDNILDRNYCDYALGWTGGASYYPACGRSFLFTLSYEF